MTTNAIAESVKNLESGDEVEATFIENYGTIFVRGIVREVRVGFSTNPPSLFVGAYCVRSGSGSENSGYLSAPVVLIKKKTQPEPPIGSVRMFNDQLTLRTYRGWVLTWSSKVNPFYTWTELLDMDETITKYTP